MANQQIPFIKMSLTQHRPLIVGNMLQKMVVQHWYYRDNKCNDIELIPTDPTQKLLKKYALKIKSLGNEYQIISLKELDSADIISQMSQEKLEFYIKLKNPYFTNFTALLEKQHPKSYYFFKQEESQGIKQEEVVMVSNVFEWTFETIESITELKLYDADDNELETIDLVDEDGFYNVSIDMNSYEEGIYSLSSEDQDQTINIFLMKVCNFSSIPSLFGLLELDLNSDIANLRTEELKFYPKKVRLHYDLYKSDTYQYYEDFLEDTSSISGETELDWENNSQNVVITTIENITTIKSTTGGNWGHSGAFISQTIALEEDAFMSATANFTGKLQAFGFSLEASPVYHFTNMHVGLLLKTNGNLTIVEGGSERTTTITYEKEDTFCIVKLGSSVYYEKNGKILGRFRNVIEEELTPLIAIKSADAGFSNVYLHHFSSELPTTQFTRTEASEKVIYQSDLWLPYKQRPGKIIELTLTDPEELSKTIILPLRNPSAMELENQIDIEI